MRTLVAGGFSFWKGHATAGDLLAKDVLCRWLDDASLAYDVALAAPFSGGVDLSSVDPGVYSHVVFVCGPFERGELEALLLGRFAGARLIGMNLSMAEPVEVWNPFDLLLERDSSRDARPDLVFLARQKVAPVVGVCLVEPHEGAATDEAHAAIDRLVSSRSAAVVHIDTRLDSTDAPLRGPDEVEALIARMDLVVTTRLHGTVLALKNGVPVIAIDPIPGGAKIRRQAETVGWSTVFLVDALTDEALQEAFDFCLTEEARLRARASAERATRLLEGVRATLMGALLGSDEVEERFRRRSALAPAAVVPPHLPPPGAEADPPTLRTRFRRLGSRLLPRWLRALLSRSPSGRDSAPSAGERVA